SPLALSRVSQFASRRKPLGWPRRRKDGAIVSIAPAENLSRAGRSPRCGPHRFPRPSHKKGGEIMPVLLGVLLAAAATASAAAQDVKGSSDHPGCIEPDGGRA